MDSSSGLEFSVEKKIFFFVEVFIIWIILLKTARCWLWNKTNGYERLNKKILLELFVLSLWQVQKISAMKLIINYFYYFLSINIEFIKQSSEQILKKLFSLVVFNFLNSRILIRNDTVFELEGLNKNNVFKHVVELIRELEYVLTVW